MSDSRHINENDDRRIEKKVKKKNSGNKRRQAKQNLESFKYGIDEDRYYDIMDNMMED